MPKAAGRVHCPHNIPLQSAILFACNTGSFLFQASSKVKNYFFFFFSKCKTSIIKEVTLLGLCKDTTTKSIPPPQQNSMEGLKVKEAHSQRKMGYPHCYIGLTNTCNILLAASFWKRNLSLALMYTLQGVIWKCSNCKWIHYRLSRLMF